MPRSATGPPGTAPHRARRRSRGRRAPDRRHRSPAAPGPVASGMPHCLCPARLPARNTAPPSRGRCSPAPPRPRAAAIWDSRSTPSTRVRAHPAPCRADRPAAGSRPAVGALRHFAGPAPSPCAGARRPTRASRADIRLRRQETGSARGSATPSAPAERIPWFSPRHPGDTRAARRDKIRARPWAQPSSVPRWPLAPGRACSP